jgi:thiol-disulfide isomerase/thioredoxin
MRLQRRDWLILGGVAAGAAIAGGVTGALVLQAQSGAAALLSTTFLDLSDRPRRVADWPARAVLCNFWATWCAPCREELPLLESAHRDHAAIGLQLVGIAIDTAANIREYLKVVKVSFPILVGEATAIGLMRSLGNSSGALPFTAALDRSGQVRGRKLGAYTAAELHREIAGLLR